MDTIYILLFTSNFLLLSSKFSCAIDTITLSTSISDGNTIVSKDGTFELGFFSPGTSSNRYVGIWYKNIPFKTVVWVLNRCNPINDSSGLLMIDGTGNLALVGNKNKVVWSSNVKKESQSPIIQLLDSGNLVLWDERDGNNGNYMWQSFDYPSDTLVEGMKFGVNLKTGLDRHLTAWKNWDDPSPGDIVWKIQLNNYPELLTLKGSKIYFRSGPWNGISFSGAPHLRPNPIFNFSFVHNEEEVYYIFYLKQKSVISQVVLNETTSRHERTTWDEESRSWKVYVYTPTDYCDTYHLCGPNGVCLFDGYAVCQCLQGFKPKSLGQWRSMNWTQGCVRNKSLNCRDDGFIKLNGLKLPDTTYSWVNKNMNLKECRAECLQNCSCTAYTNLDIRGKGSGCAMWFNDLIDIRQYSSGGQDLYIRMPASELVDLEDAKAKSKKKIVVIIVIVISLVSGILVACYFFRIRTKVKGKLTDCHCRI